MQDEKLRMLAKIKIVILQPVKDLDLKDVILSEAKNLFFLFKSKKRSFGLTASG
jgi:hypothetical protein